MQRFVKTVVVAALFFVGVAQIYGATLSGTVAYYNAGQVRSAHGALTVPAGLVTYTASAAIPTGTTFYVTLPTGFTFASAPALTSSAATFTLVSHSGAKATFTVEGSSIVSGDTIVLGGYNIQGATALETITPVYSALPLTMQAVGIDTNPVSFREFASDSGIQAIFVGAIQFIDLNPPSNGSKFFGSPDTPTAVLSAIAITAETTDFSTNTIPILGANGETNTLSPSDTATIAFPGLFFGGIKSVFASSNSECTAPLEGKSYAVADVMVFVEVPLNSEVFFCVTGNGHALNIFPDATNETGYGFTTLLISPTQGESDFTTSTNVNIEFPGLLCYSNTLGEGGNCQAEYYNRTISPSAE